MGFDTDSLRKLRSRARSNTWTPELCSACRLSQCLTEPMNRGETRIGEEFSICTWGPGHNRENFKMPEAAAGRYLGEQTTLWCRVIEKFAPGLVFLYLPITTFMWSSNPEASSSTVLQAHAAYLHREELRELATNGPKLNKLYSKKKSSFTMSL